MKRPLMFIDWQKCEKQTTKINAITIKTPVSIFTEIEELILKFIWNFHMEKIPNNQNNPKQKQQCWKYHSTWIQIILQSHSNKNSTVLT
jgi:hypothetical protein